MFACWKWCRFFQISNRWSSQHFMFNWYFPLFFNQVCQRIFVDTWNKAWVLLFPDVRWRWRVKQPSFDTTAKGAGLFAYPPGNRENIDRVFYQEGQVKLYHYPGVIWSHHYLYYYPQSCTYYFHLDLYPMIYSSLSLSLSIYPVLLLKI